MASTARHITQLSRRCTAGIPRLYHASAALRLPYKDSQDRESLKPRSNNGTRSARDDDVSDQKDAAFNPRKTDPESELEAAGRGNETNPLSASGANQEFNKPMGEGKSAHDTGPGKETRKGGRSGGGSAPKKGKPPKGDL
ncbi:uncharacterized protein TrAFT101_002604 [Trichoderma asperellum]|uniref:Uncharacterized protein n=1 Tax=Trichoderma asperellum (strain ATCC 204424 / CBS 433.97 / NBRC 101777) TaxID=1042311 RepID=A0A2T3ZGW6_TRIA4|nr:hypothetical protein M441DRAFT_65818 [Trichoderma asperellum CBS 433.97]PTB44046.1 hypothetical protein M441DRAFT_65818 [Trichoderma asperellum CBS 433.97]UKZ86779.1 hypothetical protein TrAFT101_002604 [Trichoderma asperellum]